MPSITQNMIPYMETVEQDKLKRFKEELDEKIKKLNYLIAEMDFIAIDSEKNRIKKIIEIKKHGIKQLSKEYSELKEKYDKNLLLKKEWNRKGIGIGFILSVWSSIYKPRFPYQLKEIISFIISDLQTEDKGIKITAKQRHHLLIEEVKNPNLVIMADDYLIFPNYEGFSDIAKDYPNLNSFLHDIEELYVPKLSKDSKELGMKKDMTHSKAIGYQFNRLYNVWGDNQKIIKEIPLPNEKEIPKHGLFIGKIVGNNFKDSKLNAYFDLHKQGVLNTMISGGTGSGKSIVAKNICENALEKNIPIIILDPTGQWEGLLKRNQNKKMVERLKEVGLEPRKYDGKIFTINSDKGIKLTANLLSCPKVNNTTKYFLANDTARIIGNLIKLSENEITYLSNVIAVRWEHNYDLDYKTIKEAVESWGRNNEINITNLVLKLNNLRAFSMLFKGRGIEDISKLWKNGEISIITLGKHSNLISDVNRILFSWYILREVFSYYTNQKESDKLKLLVVIEEAHRFLSKYTNVPSNIKIILDKCTRELRKFGIGFIIISQTITDFKDALRTNTSTKIYMRNPYKPDIDRVSTLFGKEYGKLLSSMSAGIGIFSFAEFNSGRPYWIKFNPTKSNHESLNENELEKLKENYQEFEKYELKGDLDKIVKILKELDYSPHFRELKRISDFSDGKLSMLLNKLERMEIIRKIPDENDLRKKRIKLIVQNYEKLRKNY